MRTEDLTAIIDFLYHGEANVLQESLDSFLAIASELKLEGLMGSDEEEREKPKTESSKQQQMNQPIAPFISSHDKPLNQRAGRAEQ